MESASNLLIALDAGHGGSDGGGAAFGRQEKDDNLRLCARAKLELEAQGLRALCTRESDSQLPHTERARIANERDADLFISLHRGSFPKPSDEASGVAGFIYTTAHLETSGKAAQLILSALEEVGVQRVVGISRSAHAVLRRATMPALLLEIGFITNEDDNRLFDEKLADYARAIARGVCEFFGLAWDENAQPPANPPRLKLDLRGQNEIYDMQQLLEGRYGFGLAPTGRFDRATKKALIIALQIELNGRYEAALTVSGELCPRTLAAIRPILPGEQGGLCALLQVMLILRGYEPGEVDGNFTARTGSALRMFQRDRFLAPGAKADKATLLALIGKR